MTTAAGTAALHGGAAVRTITPPIGTLLSGGFTPRVSIAVELDLTVRALVLRSPETTVALVACDLLWLPDELVDPARERIFRRSGIPSSNVMISATHTHYGPYLVDRMGASRDAAYVEWVVAQIDECVAVAINRLQPVTVAVGTGAVTGVCFNRRYRMADGTVVTNPGRHNPEVVEPAGPIDPTVTSMLVESLDGTPVALWANLSLHYVDADAPGLISSDYFGHFARTVQQWLGPDVVAMLTNGASGDINNIDLEETVPNRGIVRAKQVAKAVAAAAIAAPMTSRRRADAELKAVCVPFTAARHEVTDADVELARRIIDCPAGETPPTGDFSFVVGARLWAGTDGSYADSVIKLRDMPASHDGELVLVRIGDVLLVGLPGEIFVEFGLELRRRSPFAFTAVVGLCGGSMGYVPTRRAFAEGGYETWRNVSSWTAPGTGEAMLEAVDAQFADLAD